MAKSTTLPDKALSRYWTSQRCLFDRWGQTIRKLSRPSEVTETSWQETLVPLLSEIYLGEIAARINAAFFTALDTRHQNEEAGVLGKNLLTSHLAIRNQAENLLSQVEKHQWKGLPEIYETRRQAGRWVDLLLAYLARYVDVTEFAYDKNFIAECIQDANSDEGLERYGENLSEMMADALKKSFKGTMLSNANSDVIRQILASLFEAVSESYFKETFLQEEWKVRLQNNTDETVKLLNELVEGYD